MVSSCARQGYRPSYALYTAEIKESFKDDPNLAGLTASVSTFPYFQTGTAATDEFQQAVRSYGGSSR